MPTTPRRFQFTLRHSFIATGFVSAGFAVAAFILRLPEAVDSRQTVALWFFGPLAVLGLMGAGVGALFDRTLDGLKLGLSAALLLSGLLLAGTICLSLL